MGGRKPRIGRTVKNFEKKRQGSKKYLVGRPSKRNSSQQPHIVVTTTQKQFCATSNIQQIKQLMITPQEWVSQSTSDNTIQLCKISLTEFHGSVVTHTVTIYNDLSWSAFVHGHQLNINDLSAQFQVPKKIDAHSLNLFLAKLDECTVCPGHPDEHFVEMLENRGGKITARHNDGIVAALDNYAPVILNGKLYHQTVRSTSCRVICKGVKCDRCVSYRNSLRKSYHRWSAKTQTSPSYRTSTSSSVNFSLLTTSEKNQRYAKLKERLVAAERKLKTFITKITTTDGIILDSQLHSDMEGIMHDLNEEIRENNPDGSFRRLFWDQQIQALKFQDKKRQIRWHPALIKWCLHIKYRSSSAYHAIRSTGVLTLPSERTLNDYTHVIKERVGFQKSVNQQLVNEANVKEEKDKYTVLLFDEMKIKEDLVFDKHTCELIGFVDLGEINNILDRLESQCDHDTNDSEIPFNVSDIATHMLQFMVRGIFTKLEFPLACVPTRDITGDILFPIVWEAVRNIEESGLKVILITADGAAPNRKFFHMHATSGEIVYKTPNPYSDDNRDIYFMSDVLHLIKTVRNCWSNSFAHSNSRALWVSCNCS